MQPTIENVKHYAMHGWANLEFLGCEIKFDFVEKYVGGLVPAGHSVNWLIKAFLYDSAI